jgi:hypothetical protein
MRVLRVIGLVTLGVTIGVGSTLATGRVTAQTTSRRLTAAGTSTEWAGDYPFRFIKDTKTGSCFLVSLSGGEGGTGPKPTVTAIARAEDASCF